jgi:esterase/lipase superfamily enzyme
MQNLPLVAAFFSGLMLCACESDRASYLSPIEVSAPGASKVEMLVATTRAPSKDPNELFNGERGTDLSLLDIVVSIPPDSVRKIGEVQFPNQSPPDASREFGLISAREVNVAEARARIEQRVRTQHGGHVLLFVHGYNNRFDTAIFRFAQIAHDSRTKAAPLLFTWPSRGRLLAYNYDKESANYSRDGLEALLRALSQSSSVTDVTILAHSMGNWLTMETLRQMAIRDRRLPGKIRNVVLAAADIDIDVFATQVARLGDKRPKFTAFIARDDDALLVSSAISGRIERLGALDPDNKQAFGLLRRYGIDVFDLSSVKAGDTLGHNRFAESPDIVRFIGTRLVAGQRLNDETRTSLGDTVHSAATGLGSLAGLIVTAPIAAVDPGTRRGFSERLEEILLD